MDCNEQDYKYNHFIILDLANSGDLDVTENWNLLQLNTIFITLSLMN